MGSDKKVFHFDEVDKHNQANDYWVIVHGKVYDVTPFMEDHPGGDDVLISSTGRDASKDFDDSGHSDSAIEITGKYYIGEMDVSTIPKKRKFNPPLHAAYHLKKSNDSAVQILRSLLPLLMLGVAFAVRQYIKND